MTATVRTAVAPGDSRARIRWVGFVTIVRREFGRILRIWGQTIVPPAITATCTSSSSAA